MQSHDQVLPQPMEYLWTLHFEALQNIPIQSPIFLIWANLHFMSTQILPIRSTRHHPSLHPINTLSPILIVFKDAKSYDKNDFSPLLLSNFVFIEYWKASFPKTIDSSFGKSIWNILFRKNLWDKRKGDKN